MTANLAASYAVCRRFSKRSGSNFLLSFWFLPREKRQAMYALYAFFRHTDDLADAEDGGDNAVQLGEWRNSLQAALQGEFRDPRLPALADTLRRYSIPAEYLFESIAGVESDLTRRRFASFAELEHYCYQVASTIGLCCLPVWGVRAQFNHSAAVATGIAFQLTNILRDLREDALRGRIYLPQDELAQFGVSEAELLAGRTSPAFLDLMRFQIDRAQARFIAAEPLRDDLSPEGRRIFDAMTETYRGLLTQIARDPSAVLRQRLHVGRWQKLKMVASLAMSRMTRRRPIAMETS